MNNKGDKVKRCYEPEKDQVTVHTTCTPRLLKEGGSAGCCWCELHQGCEVAEKVCSCEALKKEVARLNGQLATFKSAEKETSDAYLRIRALLNAYDTKPGGLDRFRVTEEKLKNLMNDAVIAVDEVDRLKKELEVVREELDAIKECHDGDLKYITQLKEAVKVAEEGLNFAYHAIRSHTSVYSSCRGAIGTMNEHEYHLQRGHDACEKALSTIQKCMKGGV